MIALDALKGTVGGFLSKYALMGCGIVMAGMLAVIGFQYVQNAELKVKLANQETQATQLQDKIDAQSAAIKEQNDKIAEQSKQLLTLQGQVKTAAATSQAILVQNRKLLEQLRNAPVPKDCNGAAQWTVEQLPTILKDWKE